MFMTPAADKNTAFIPFVTKVRYVILALACFILMFVTDSLFNRYTNRIKTRNFENEIRRASADLSSTGLQMYNAVSATKSGDLFKNNIFTQDYQKKGYSFLIYRNDNLIAWTDNHLVTGNKVRLAQKDSIVLLSNGWYLCSSKDSAGIRVNGFALIKSHYDLDNHYLQSSFHSRYQMESSVYIVQGASTAYRIKAPDGHVWCSLRFSQVAFLWWQKTLLILLLCFGVLFLFMYLTVQIRNQSSDTYKVLWILGMAGLFLCGKSITVWIKKPVFMYSSELFSPLHFASSAFLQSLGDLLTLSLIVLFFIYRLCRDVPFLAWSRNKSQVFTRFLLGLMLFAGISTFFIIRGMVSSIVVNSDISFEFHRISEITVLSFFGLLSVGATITSFAILMDKIVGEARQFVSFNGIILYIGSAVLLSTLLFGTLLHFSYIDSALAMLAIMMIIVLKHYRFLDFQQSLYMYISVLVLSLIAAYFFNYSNNEKKQNEKNVLAINLSTEHDAIAEYLLQEVDLHLQTDSRLRDMICSEHFSFNRMMDYVRNQYFTGYWNNYEIQITLCSQTDSVNVEPDLYRTPCFGFFDQMIHERGKDLPGTSFSFMDNNNGRVSYLGIFHYEKNNQQVALYVELDSKVNTDEVGYPALLLNKEHQTIADQDYSFAKYYKGQLVSQAGPFHYAFLSAGYPYSGKETEEITFGNFHHLFYKPNKDYLIIVSSSFIHHQDILILFSYISVVFFLLVSAFVFFRNRLKKRNFFFGMRNKIMISIVGISLAALIALGTLLSYLLIKQYTERHSGILSEKLNAVYFYLMDNPDFLSMLQSDENSSSDIEPLLIKSSNFFYCDINLYSLEGRLIATSRPEIFRKNLMSRQMNPQAFYNLSVQKNSELIIQEHIGTMSYISAFTPLFNEQNKVIAYLNLPYFSKQDELKNEMSRMIITIINFSVLLIILAVFLSFILSNTLTYPLRLIQMKFQQITLVEMNEKIDYDSRDEIGDLIRAYNRMIDELDRSVQLLARSERESAWREMAKQVAHEIKNPLTPMKLSIQQMQRAISESKENPQEYVRKLSATIIEQIDNLSNIATEFSNFAKMPKANNEKIELIQIIQSVTALYSDKNIVLTRNGPEALVMADKEQIRRVFINLIANALQAITVGGKELIEVTVNTGPATISVEVKDNGSGVAPDVEARLFQPNFTTKSSGSGLGLAMVKNIIENAGGAIVYRPNPQGGAIFLLEFPRVE